MLGAGGCETGTLEDDVSDMVLVDLDSDRTRRALLEVRLTFLTEKNIACV